MTADYFDMDPTALASWRMAVLMGANSRTYKFALGSALLDHAHAGRTEVTLAELAAPYAMRLVDHLDAARTRASLPDWPTFIRHTLTIVTT